MKGILELIKLIYGSKALSKILGTRTNVIRLPDNELKQYTKKELNIEAASDKLAQKAKADMKELLADYPRMNDAEKLIFEGNLRRLGNKLEVVQKKQVPAADVLEFGTGEKVSPEGIMSLTEKAGQKNPPTTLMGKLESRVKQLEASGKDLETIAKEKGGTDLNDFFSNFAKDQKAMMKLEDQGLVRATAREIINRDIKSGKIKLPKEIEQDMVQGGGEPINVLRQFYGEDALEQLDSMIPELRNFYTAKEAADAVNKKFKFEFKADRLPESISIEDAKKAEQEFNIVPADSEEGKVITEKLIGKPKASVTELMTAEKIISDMKKMDPMDAMKEANKVLKKEGKYKNLQEKDVERIMEDTNDFIFGRDIPEDPEGFAVGGRVGMAAGGITKLVKKAMEFFNDNNPVSAYKKYLKYVKETAQKDPAKLAPEVGGIVVGSELIHRGLRRKLKEAKEKNDTDDSEDTTTEDRTEKAGGGVSQGLDYLMGIERRGYQEGSSTLSREEIINRILQEIKPGFESAREVYPDYYSTGLDVDYLKTLDPDEIKQALDRAYLQGEGFQNADFTSGRIGQGSPFFRYSPEYMKKVNYNNPLQISNSNTAYNLRNQLNELESILGKKNIEAYKTTLDDSLIDYYKNRFTADLDLQKKLFGEQTTPTVEEQIISPDDAMNQYDISNQMNEGQITSFDSIGNRLENIVNNPAIKGFTNFVTGSGNPFQDISQFTPSQQSVINQAIENAAKEGRTNITYADYPKTGVAQLADDGFSPMEYVKTLGSSIIGNPVDQIKTTLGQFAYDPQQQQIKDFYDFQKQSGNNLGTSYPININVSNPKEKLQQLPYMDQYQKDYQTRISQVDPNALRNRYLENLQNTSSQDINQFQSQLRSNLVPRENQPQGLDYLTGL
jgi:hypothetical protein